MKLTTSIEQLEAIIKKAKLARKSNVNLSTVIDITQYDGCKTVKLCAHDELKNESLIINEFYDTI